MLPLVLSPAAKSLSVMPSQTVGSMIIGEYNRSAVRCCAHHSTEYSSWSLLAGEEMLWVLLKNNQVTMADSEVEQAFWLRHKGIAGYGYTSAGNCNRVTFRLWKPQFALSEWFGFFIQACIAKVERLTSLQLICIHQVFFKLNLLIISFKEKQLILIFYQRNILSPGCTTLYNT